LSVPFIYIFIPEKYFKTFLQKLQKLPKFFLDFPRAKIFNHGLRAQVRISARARTQNTNSEHEHFGHALYKNTVRKKQAAYQPVVKLLLDGLGSVFKSKTNLIYMVHLFVHTIK
jgi:hypothetical protein